MDNVTGQSRTATFQMDEMTKRLTMVKKDEVEKKEKSYGEMISVSIRDEDTRSNLHQRWIYLKGTPRQIIADVAEHYPVLKLESDKLFDMLDEIGEEEVANIICTPDQNYEITLRSKIYKTLMACQTAIIECMYDLKEGTVNRL